MFLRYILATYKTTSLYILLLSICAAICEPIDRKCKSNCCVNNPAVKKFQEYLRIDTSHEENLKYSVEFWERQALQLELSYAVHYPAGKPICVITWTGSNPSLPSIMLNSHADVVKVEEKYWTYPPFSAHIDENCNIYARGTQDTKSVTIQYLEAIRVLKQRNISLLRTLHIVIMPDEESGGFYGIKPFITTKEFSLLNVGFALDEGLTSADDTFYATYVDKRPWQMKFSVFGKSGHGFALGSGSALEKLQKLLNIVMKFREEQNQIKNEKDPLDFGGHTSVNINIIEGGIATNIIPTEMHAIIDMRLAVGANIEDMATMVESWRREAGNDTTIEFIRHDLVSTATVLDSNPYWQAMMQTSKDIGINIKPVVCPATSDMLVVRNAGFPAIGFAPKVRTPSLLHANNEYLSVDVFLEGINVYVALIQNLANLPEVDAESKKSCSEVP